MAMMNEMEYRTIGKALAGGYRAAVYCRLSKDDDLQGESASIANQRDMVYAMVFGAHLFPYSWLYKSKGYTVVAISIPVISLILGCTLNGTTVAAAACIIEVVFACVLHMELKKMADN